MRVSKIKKKLNKKFISKKKQMGKGFLVEKVSYGGSEDDGEDMTHSSASHKKQRFHWEYRHKNNHVTIYPFAKHLTTKIMKEVVCESILELSADYDKEIFQFYNPRRKIMFKYDKNNKYITGLIIKDGDYFTESELEEIHFCLFMASGKYAIDLSKIDEDQIPSCEIPDFIYDDEDEDEEKEDEEDEDEEDEDDEDEDEDKEDEQDSDVVKSPTFWQNPLLYGMKSVGLAFKPKPLGFRY